MELRPNEEIIPLEKMIREWLQHRDRELEASFGGVDATTFLHVAQRLKSKGYTEIQQEDYLNIITPEKVRFTITSSVFIEDYCRTDVIEGKTFTAMIKDKTGGESTLDFDEYATRIKVRREFMLKPTDADVVRLLRVWATQKKAFRVIKRWTFIDEKKGLRFDLSVIRSTPTDRQGNYLWQTKFQQQDITREPLKYEIEVELLRPEIDSGVNLQDILGEMVKSKKTHFISGIGDVLRGIQKHTFLIRKSVAQKALRGYEELVGSNRFRGVQPKPMEKRNMIEKREDGVPNIRNGYNVTDKADGLRMMGYVDNQGELFLLDMSLRVYRTGLKRLGCANSLVDGEFITKDKYDVSVLQYLIFDIYIAPEKTDVTQLPFYTTETNSRYDALQDWITRWSKDEGPTAIPGAGVTVKNCITVAIKEFLFAIPGKEDIFECCRKTLMYAQTQPYKTDGLILTPNEKKLPQKHGVRFVEQMKWKPAKDNTIDFLVLMDRDNDQDIVRTAVKPGTNETVMYKTMRLYVGSENDPAYTNPRGTVLMKQPLPGAYDKNRFQGREYKAVLFNPIEFPDTMANICYAEVEVNIDTNEDVVFIKETGDIVQHKTIVEMTYEPTNEPGWRWVPLRVRHDKTERYLSGKSGPTFNNDGGAEIVWNSIHDPITEHMITTGAEVPSEKELKKTNVVANDDLVGKVYYDHKGVKKDIQIIRGLRDFHRLYIKEGILLNRGLRGGGKILADLACGQGGDLNTWIREKVGFVFGTDIAADGITNPHSGAYRRYLDEVMKRGGYDNLPKMIFTIGSSAKRISTGEAGATTEEADIMRSVYGRTNTQGLVPPFVQEYGANRLRNGADCVAIMFAIHYFFENQQSLETIIANISDSLKIGGLFVGCCFDGERIFNELQTIQEGGSVVGQENNTEIWKITKRYSNTDFTSGLDSLGMGIDVQFMSIGTEQREYLVSFELLKNEMAKIGCELLTPEECKELNLVHSTNTFDKSYDMAVKEGLRYPMAPDVARYSFFNRWFIFKRRRLGLAVEEEEEGTTVNIGSSSNVRTVMQQAQQQPQVERKLTLAEKAAQINQEAMAQSTKPTGKEKKEVDGEVMGAVPEKTKFDDKELLKFYLDASRVDRLKLNNVDAIRGLSPSFHFPIRDEEGKEYPSVEHYYYAMKFKLASNTPEKAKDIFSTEGVIHQKFNVMRQAKAQTTGKAEALTDEDYNSIKEERKAILAELTDKQLKRYKTVFDTGKWETIKDKVLYDALEQRYQRDDMYHRTVEKAIQMGLYLLYYTGPTAGSELGGKMNPDQTIDGQNKIGKMMMRIAGA
jgi:hypothetical protein